MTLLSPTLIVTKLLVIKDGYTVLEVAFHKGLNILRGHNSSGKTTTLDFVAHTLGAEEIPWKKESLLCDYSVVEVLLNDRPVSLRRHVTTNRQQPMQIFWGPISEAMLAPVTSWEVYPFRRSQSKLSFTQTLLMALGMSEAQGDGASNLTMHQFLRVMYADQPSLHSPIFRIDSFDSGLTRETVGSYLSGIYDDALYSAQLSRRNLEKELASAESELRSIFAVLAKSRQDVNLEFFGQQIIEAETRREALLKEISRLKAERTVLGDGRRVTEENTTRTALDAANKELRQVLDLVARKEIELADSSQFIDEVEGRLGSLKESEAARSYFGSIAFNFCPCCLSELKPVSSEAKICSLCSNPLDVSASESQLLRMRNELLVQLKESQSNIQAKQAEVQALRIRVPGLRQALRTLEQRYKEITQNWSSELEVALERASRDVGALDQEIKGLFENQRLASVIKDLQLRRDTLQMQMRELDSLIERLVFAQENRKGEVAYAVTTALSRLLKLDFYRQEEFKTAEHVQFSFVDNQVVVDGSAKFSESSTVVLRHLFHLALLTASTRTPAMRFPRFLMLDGIEDGGMELARAYRLQQIIADECASYEVDYQLIMATSQIAPTVDIEAFVVGREFSEQERALSIR